MDESKDIPGAECEQAGDVSAADIVLDWYNGTSGDTAESGKPERNSGMQDDWPEEELSQPGGENDATPEKGREADQSFTLKHLGQVCTVNRDEVIALAQKGLDYDRQRQKNEELVSRNKALSSEAPQETTEQRRSSEVREFVAEYGSVDPKTIPEEVWAAVRDGKQLLNAYQSWELKKLRSEQKAAAAADENREKSAGSRASAGSTRYHDAITADWYSS